MPKSVLIFLFMSLLVAFRCDAELPPVKIGALLPLTGEFAMQAAAFQEGIRLAEDEINGGGGVGGRLIKVVFEDTHSDPKLANSAAKKLISIDRVIAGITTSYPETEIGGGHFQRAKIPSIGLWDSSPEIDAMGEYIFALGPWVPSGAEVGAKFAFTDLNARKVVIVNTVEPWSELISDLFAKNFERHGGKVVARFPLNPGGGDFRTVLTKIKAIAPDLIYAPLTDGIIPFHTQRTTAHITIPVMSADIISEEHITKRASTFENVYQSGIRDPERPKMRELAERYQKVYDRSLTMPWFVGTGYDALTLYAEAIRKVGPDAQKIKEFLYTVQDFPGAAQKISITPGGSSPYPSSMFQIKAGKFHPVELK